ncbi:hypothetical protein DOY81_001628 [Sarcophaga bullata]|nr:hypothetical protein DOY81_001628 [Sarcophaga bullata]
MRHFAHISSILSLPFLLFYFVKSAEKGNKNSLRERVKKTTPAFRLIKSVGGYNGTLTAVL